MTIKYTIRSNKMVGKEHEHAAMVRPIFSADIEKVIEEMMQQGCALSKAATLGVLEMFFSAIERLVLMGANVTTPLVNVHASIAGLFRGHDDRFDRRRHRIEVRVTPGARLRRTVRRYARAERIAPRGQPQPYPAFFEDIESGEKDSILTPGGLGRLYGARLKFDPADPRQGVFFIAADKSATRAGSAAENHPQQLIFLIPPLPAGAYTLEVRNLAEDSSDLRRGTLGCTLTVTAPDTMEMPLAWAAQPHSAGVQGAS